MCVGDLVNNSEGGVETIMSYYSGVGGARDCDR